MCLTSVRDVCVRARVRVLWGHNEGKKGRYSYIRTPTPNF